MAKRKPRSRPDSGGGPRRGLRRLSRHTGRAGGARSGQSPGVPGRHLDDRTGRDPRGHRTGIRPGRACHRRAGGDVGGQPVRGGRGSDPRSLCTDHRGRHGRGNGYGPGGNDSGACRRDGDTGAGQPGEGGRRRPGGTAMVGVAGATNRLRLRRESASRRRRDRGVRGDRGGWKYRSRAGRGSRWEGGHDLDARGRGPSGAHRQGRAGERTIHRRGPPGRGSLDPGHHDQSTHRRA